MESANFARPILHGMELNVTAGLDFSPLQAHVNSAAPTQNSSKINASAISAFSVTVSPAQPAILPAAHVQALFQPIASLVPTLHTHSQVDPAHSDNAIQEIISTQRLKAVQNAFPIVPRALETTIAILVSQDSSAKP
jgi:hypothetical protein